MLKKHAFTIIELLIIFSIIAILTIIGVPAYDKYRVRSKVAVMIASASAAELAIANDYFNQGYTFANSNYSAGSQPFLTPQSNFISSISVSAGVITVAGDASNLGGRSITLTFTPTVSENNITWLCSTSSTYYDYVPDECRN